MWWFLRKSREVQAALQARVVQLEIEREAYRQEVFESNRYAAWVGHERQTLIDRLNFGTYATQYNEAQLRIAELEAYVASTEARLTESEDQRYALATKMVAPGSLAPTEAAALASAPPIVSKLSATNAVPASRARSGASKPAPVAATSAAEPSGKTSSAALKPFKASAAKAKVKLGASAKAVQGSEVPSGAKAPPSTRVMKSGPVSQAKTGPASVSWAEAGAQTSSDAATVFSPVSPAQAVDSQAALKPPASVRPPTSQAVVPTAAPVPVRYSSVTTKANAPVVALMKTGSRSKATVAKVNAKTAQNAKADVSASPLNQKLIG